MRLLALDPGANKHGWGYYKGLVLLNAGYSAQLPPFGVDLVVMELPQIYPQRRQKGDPNDLVHVAAEGALAAARVGGPQVLFFLPREWKGTTPKEITHERTRTFFEKNSCGRSLQTWADLHRNLGKTVRHNALDACAFGLWAAQKGADRLVRMAALNR